MSSIVEIETAIELLALPEKRELFDFLASQLEADAGGAAFPDLKCLLLEFPDVGTEDDFARLSEMPRELDVQ